MLYKLIVQGTLKEINEVIKKLQVVEKSKVRELKEPKRNARKNKKWTDYEITILCDWYKKGHKVKDIAKSIERPVTAVRQKLHLLMLKGLRRRNNLNGKPIINNN